VLQEDSDIISYSTADNQRMWQLGDCAEVFLKNKTSDDYWEIHVTPNAHLMDIHIPDREGFGMDKWDEVVAAESGTEYRVSVGEGSWAAELLVPFAALGLDGPPAAGTYWQWHVGRYNSTSDQELREDGTIGGSAENSSTAPLTESGFHRHEEFNQLYFDGKEEATGARAKL